MSAVILDETVGSLLRWATEQTPSAVALVEGLPDPADRRRWRYAELLAESEQVAQALLSRFEPGERIAVWANNIPEWVLLELAAGLAGLTLVTVNPALRERELAHVLAQSRSAGIFLVRRYRDNPLLETLTAVRPELPDLHEVLLFEDWVGFRESGSPTEVLPYVSPDDPAQIQYTSGTTGRPKGAVLRHRGIINNARLSYVDTFEMAPGEVFVNPMPLFHTAGCVQGTLAPLASLGTHVLVPGFDPALQLLLTESERGAQLCGVPTMLLAMLSHPAFAGTDLSSVRYAISGGATVAPDIVRRVEAALGVPMAIVYAQTEASPCITMTRLDDAADDRAETIGRALPGAEVRIVRPGSGEPAGLGEIGELCTRGYCRIECRLKELIIRGGENIYPREIEQLLITHPTVEDVAVVGIPDPYWGEQVAAFIRPAGDLTPDPDTLQTFVQAQLAPHKIPRIVDTFPTTASGKIQKYALRDQLR